VIISAAGQRVVAQRHRASGRRASACPSMTTSIWCDAEDASTTPTRRRVVHFGLARCGAPGWRPGDGRLAIAPRSPIASAYRRSGRCPGRRGRRPSHARSTVDHARAHHRRLEAHALLVGPIDHLDRVTGDVSGALQRPQHFQPAQHAEDAIETAALAHGIEVGTDLDRRQVLAASPPRDDVADVIDTDRRAGRARIGAETMTGGAIPPHSPRRVTLRRGARSRVGVEARGASARVDAA